MPVTWKTALRQLLKQPASKSGSLPRIAILGVGNEIRSDDAAGVVASRALLQRDLPAEDGVLILEAGHAPENRTGELRRFNPDVVLIIDAANVGEQPGTIQFIPAKSIDGMSASTHSLPLSMLARYLQLDINCVVAFLGIQPDSNEVGGRVSPEVFAAVHELVDELDTLIYRRER